MLDSPSRLVRKLLAEYSGTSPEPTFVTTVCNEISWARAKVIAPGDYPEAASRAG